MTAGRPHSSEEWLPISRVDDVVAMGPWLLRLRWGAGLGVLAATALARQLLGVSVPVVPMAVVGLVILAYNAGLWLAFKRVRSGGRVRSVLATSLTHLELVLD